MWRSFAFSVFLMLTTSPAVTGNDGYLGWITYRNDEFGLVLEYPDHIFKADDTNPTSAGQVFVSANGDARLLVGAIRNLDNHSPESYRTFISRELYAGFDVDYSPAGRSWTVISGARDDTMFYQNVMFSCAGDVINSFALTYPVTQRKVYDPIVERIEDSFRVAQRGCRDGQ